MSIRGHHRIQIIKYAKNFAESISTLANSTYYKSSIEVFCAGVYASFFIWFVMGMPNKAR